MRNATTLAVIGAALLLGACSHSNPGTENAPVEAHALVANLPPSAPVPDANTPDQAYVQIESAVQVLALNSALSAKPKLELMAGATSGDYRDARDSFKKHDILQGIQPKFEAAIAEAKDHRYITWINDYPQIRHFDFNAHAFPVETGLFQLGGSTQFYEDHQPYGQITVSNGADFRALHVTDDTTARTMEALVDKGHGLRLKIYAFAQGTDDSGTPTVQATITKIQVLGASDQVLFEQKAGGAP